MSYIQDAGFITFTYLIDDLFEAASRETYAIAKNKQGENGPLVDRIAMSEDERVFFDDYLYRARDMVLAIIGKMTYGISDPVTTSSTSLVFKITDKTKAKKATLNLFDEKIKKAIADTCIYEWLVKVEQYDLAKTYAARLESEKTELINLSVEIRLPII